VPAPSATATSTNTITLAATTEARERPTGCGRAAATGASYAKVACGPFASEVLHDAGDAADDSAASSHLAYSPTALVTAEPAQAPGSPAIDAATLVHPLIHGGRLYLLPGSAPRGHFLSNTTPAASRSQVAAVAPSARSAYFRTRPTGLRGRSARNST
jgi:hypothetical protein